MAKASQAQVQAAKQRVTRQQYDAMVVSFRRHPGQPVVVGREVGVWSGTAKRYWERGGACSWAVPIKGIIAGEQDAARALLQQEADAARDERVASAQERGRQLGALDAEAARDDKRDSLRAQARITRATRDNAIDFLEVASELLGATKQIRDDVLDSLRTGALRDKVIASPTFGIALIRELGKIVNDAQLVARVAIELEHLTLGQPSGATPTVVGTDEDALAIIVRASAAMRRAKGFVDTTATDAEPPRRALAVADEREAG